MRVSTTRTGTVPRRRLDVQIKRLEARLVREQEQVPPTVLHEWVERACARFAGARVLDFVPILVERAVRARVQASGEAFVAGNDTAAGGHEQDGVPLPGWARHTAEQLLAQELPRRWAHTQGVARRAEQVARFMPPDDRPVLVAAAWLHDIGYASGLTDTGLHSLDGARFLARQGVPPRVCALVAHHSGAAAVANLLGLADELATFPDECGLIRDALWYSDMTTDPDGHPITVSERLTEIQRRRGPDDPVVRALSTNVDERVAAVRRIHDLLCQAAA